MKSKFERKLKKQIDRSLERECPRDESFAPAVPAAERKNARYRAILKFSGAAASVAVICVAGVLLATSVLPSFMKPKSANNKIARAIATAAAGSRQGAVSNDALANRNYAAATVAPVMEALGDAGIQAPEIAADASTATTGGYAGIIENPMMTVAADPISTFSIDVDTASYSNIRAYINAGVRPPADAVRIEEMINYFKYDYPQPTGDDPFSVSTEIGKCPWDASKYLAVIGLQGRIVPKEQLPNSNLVFLLDVSGSMGEPNKLPLLVSSMKLLVEQMTENDRISIVTYAGGTNIVLEGARGDQKAVILTALDKLQAGGSTSGAAGIQLAYDTAVKYLIAGGNNRVLLATDGDFNVGISDPASLKALITEKRTQGVFLSVMGFGMGNLQDDNLETLADAGNGNYSYIDTIEEAQKVLVSEMGGTLFTIAKDVKIQVVFDPAVVSQYRLVGYENRVMSAQDFTDDTKDAGEVGSGHTVTAIYEIVPVGAMNSGDKNFDISVRYKKPAEDVSNELKFTALYDLSRDSTSKDFNFAAAVAEFGMILRNSAYKGTASISGVMGLALNNLGSDPGGYRKEFMNLAKRFEELK